MKCMCPNCGNIIKNGQLSFDFTDFIRDTLDDIIESIGNGSDDVKDGKDILLNACIDKNPILLSEEYLWDYPSSLSAGDNKKEKCIDFLIPIDSLLKKNGELCESGEYEGYDRERVDSFIEWIEDNKDKITENTTPIRLVATGDGDIKFDRIPGVAEARKCPYCHSEMSYWAGRYTEWTLTVLGGPRVSKSTAVTACVAAFMKHRDSLVKFEGTDKDKGYKLFKEQCLDKYEQGLDLGATDTNADNIPRVSFRVTIGNRDICLTFVDVPGEFNNENGIAAQLDDRYSRIFKNIDFVWYCTDPGEVQQLQSSDIVKHSLGYADKGVMGTDRIKDNMRALAAYFRHNRRVVPVAYIMGKTDSEAISDDDKEKYSLYNDYQPEIKLPFNVKAFFKRSEKVKKYISSKNNDGLVEEFERMFPQRCYIATSAYGYNPKDGIPYNPIKRSYNCKEAFYWMLAIRNCVDICVQNTKSGLFGGQRTVEVEGKLSELPDVLREKTYRNLYMSGNYVT